MIPSQTLQSLRDNFGPEADAWLPIAQSQLQQLAKKWQITIAEPLEGATCSLVFKTTNRQVIKLPHPLSEEAKSIPIQQAFSNHGGVEIFQSDEQTGATLMPLLAPGTNILEHFDTDQETKILAQVIKKLRQAPPTKTTPLKTWLRDLDTSDHPLATPARQLAKQLIETTQRECLLHADLHHFNLLKNGNDWVAIDPKGILGDPAFECSSFLKNPAPMILDHPDLANLQTRRIKQLTQLLQVPEHRIWGWGFVHATISSIWAKEPPDSPWFRVAETLYNLRHQFQRPIE